MAFDRRIWQRAVQQKRKSKYPALTLLPPSNLLLLLPLTTPNLKPQDGIVQFWGHRMEYGSVESRRDDQMEISSPTLIPVLLIAVDEDTGPHL